MLVSKSIKPVTYIFWYMCMFVYISSICDTTNNSLVEYAVYVSCMIHILHILLDYCFLLGKTVLSAISIIALCLTCLLCFVRSLYIILSYIFILMF